MGKKNDGSAQSHRESAEQTDESSNLATLVFVAAKKIGNSVKNYAACLVVARSAFDFAKQRRWLDLSIPVKDGDGRIFPRQVYKPEPCQLFVGWFQIFRDLFKTKMNLGDVPPFC